MESKFTSVSEVNIVKFDKFLKEVPIVEVELSFNKTAKYLEWTEREPFTFGFLPSSPSKKCDFFERSARLTTFDMLDQLFLILPIEERQLTKPLQELEDLVIDQAMKYGSPDKAVLLDSRTWLVADSNDFNVLVNTHHPLLKSLVCIHPYRNKIVRYKKG